MESSPADELCRLAEQRGHLAWVGGQGFVSPRVADLSTGTVRFLGALGVVSREVVPRGGGESA